MHVRTVSVVSCTVLAPAGLLGGCHEPVVSTAPAKPVVAVSRTRPVPVARLPVARQVALSKPGPLPSTSSRAAAHLVAPKTLGFVQDGLHNCGTVAMLISWARTRPRQAANLVRRQEDGNFLVEFAGSNPVMVTPADLAAASKIGVVRSPRGSRWAEIVLTAFTKLKSRGSTPDFALIEWIYAGEIASCLAASENGFFEIKPELQKSGSAQSSGAIEVGKPVALSVLDRQLRVLQGRPAVVYTNRRIHIWAILGYDARRRMVQVRNPRRRNAVWMPLSSFRDKFQLLVYSGR